MPRIIRSMTDNDLYKFTMQQAVLSLYPGTPVVYEFTDRKPTGQMDKAFLSKLCTQIEAMSDLRLTNEEAAFLSGLGFLSPQYIDWLRNFRYDPSAIRPTLDADGRLSIRYEGSWEDMILWEVPLLSLTSECYFEDAIGGESFGDNFDRLHTKGGILRGLRFADFGTRRRRSFEHQEQAVEVLRKYEGFQGTSNVHLARQYGLKAIGTMAHEWIMGVSVMEGLRHANRHALRAWNSVYKGRLGIALTDTYGTGAFWEDFDPELSRLYDGVRHDSACPYRFTDQAINHYKSVGVYPLSKTVVYSDGLTPQKCREISDRYNSTIGQSFGIGTNLTNDVPGGPKPLNIVIKLRRCNNVDVVKLSDEPGKGTGEKDAQRVARYVFFGTPLDA